MEFKVPELGEGVESATVAGIRVQPGAALSSKLLQVHATAKYVF